MCIIGHFIICFLHKLFSGAVINTPKISGRISNVKNHLKTLVLMKV
jgi:hypothetical protein